MVGKVMKGKIVLLAMAAVLAGACQRDAAPEPAADPAQAPAQTADPATQAPPGAMQPELPAEPAAPQRNTAVVDARIENVVLSDQGDPDAGTIGAPKARFEPTDTVYAAVETDGTANEYTLYAKWTDANGEVLSDYGMTVDGVGKQRKVLSLSKPDGWAEGRYGIELVINDGNRRTVNFDVGP